MLQKFIPGFLKKMDHYLLTNYPVIWKSRVHFVAFYSLILGNLGAILLGYVYPMSLKSIPLVYNVTSIFLLVCVFLGFGVLSYATQQRKFPLQDVSPLKRIMIIPLFIVCLTSFAVNVAVFQETVISRVASLIGDQELETDMPMLEQVMDYQFNVDNFTQYNLNVRQLQETVAKYHVPTIEFNYNRSSPRYNNDEIEILKKKIHSLNAAKWHTKNFNSSNFISFNMNHDCYYNRLSIYSGWISMFWNFSMFAIPLLVVLIFLMTYYTSAWKTVGLLFGGFVSLIILVFLGQCSGFDIGHLVYITLPLIACFPFLFRRNTTISWWVTRITILLLPTISIGFMLIEYTFDHDLIKLLVLNVLMAIVVAIIYGTLSKDKLPQTL